MTHAVSPIGSVRARDAVPELSGAKRGICPECYAVRIETPPCVGHRTSPILRADLLRVGEEAGLGGHVLARDEHYCQFVRISKSVENLRSYAAVAGLGSNG